jgi:hypothetical protein
VSTSFHDLFLSKSLQNILLLQKRKTQTATPTISAAVETIRDAAPPVLHLSVVQELQVFVVPAVPDKDGFVLI